MRPAKILWRTLRSTYISVRSAQYCLCGLIVWKEHRLSRLPIPLPEIPSALRYSKIIDMCSNLKKKILVFHPLANSLSHLVFSTKGNIEWDWQWRRTGHLARFSSSRTKLLCYSGVPMHDRSRSQKSPAIFHPDIIPRCVSKPEDLVSCASFVLSWINTSLTLLLDVLRRFHPALKKPIPSTTNYHLCCLPLGFLDNINISFYIRLKNWCAVVEHFLTARQIANKLRCCIN